MRIESLELETYLEKWPLVTPFRITGHSWEFLDVLMVTLEKDGHVGRGEAAGVYYRKDTPGTMIRHIEAQRAAIQAGLSRASVQELFPAGGARNALDCALWDLEAKLAGVAVWQLLDLEKPRPLLSTFTCGANDPETMAATARAYRGARAIKLKLTGEPIDAARIRAVRESLPDVWLGVDANQGFTRASLEALMPVLVAARVSLIEQPFPIGQESLLDGLQSPIPIAADESVQTLADVAALAGRVQVMNVKLDKCGGLTEAINMSKAARAIGIEIMVGNMLGTSLAMAPAFLLGQICSLVDLDGPVFLQKDRASTVQYRDGLIDCPESLWGSPDLQA